MSPDGAAPATVVSTARMIPERISTHHDHLTFPCTPRLAACPPHQKAAWDMVSLQYRFVPWSWEDIIEAFPVVEGEGKVHSKVSLEYLPADHSLYTSNCSSADRPNAYDTQNNGAATPQRPKAMPETAGLHSPHVLSSERVGQQGALPGSGPQPFFLCTPVKPISVSCTPCF